MNNPVSLSLEDFPQYAKVFEDEGYEARIEQRGGDGDRYVLCYREKNGHSGWSIYPLDDLAKIVASNPERIDAFFEHLWHQIEIYPQIPQATPADVDYSVWRKLTRDSLPETGQDVLVFGETFLSNGPQILVAHYRENSSDMFAERFSIFDHGTHSRKQLSRVSHWAYLLPPPTN